MSRKSTGETGERLAADFLKGKGFQIIEKNYRTRGGEIDIVAMDGECVAFVEVRTKRNLNFGSPEESISPRKMGRIRITAERYLQEHPDLPEDWRIDVVAIELGSGDRPKRIELLQNAVGEG